MPRPKRAPFTEEELAQKAIQNRVNVAEHKARMDAMTRLEQAAWRERKVLGEPFEPYTPDERIVAERIRAECEALLARAEAFHAQITGRLEREAQENPQVAHLRARFSEMRGIRLELPAF